MSVVGVKWVTLANVSIWSDAEWPEEPISGLIYPNVNLVQAGSKDLGEPCQ